MNLYILSHFRFLIVSRGKRELGRETLLFTLLCTTTRLSAFCNLLRDAISVGDRSISRRVHAPRIAHTRMCGTRACRHTRTRVRAERSRKDESTSFARVPTYISVFPRCYANERASKTAILGQTSSSRRLERTEIEDVTVGRQTRPAVNRQ